MLVLTNVAVIVRFVSMTMLTGLFEPLASPKNASLLFALSYLAVLYVILWAMYRRRIFLKV